MNFIYINDKPLWSSALGNELHVEHRECLIHEQLRLLPAKTH